MPLRRTLVCLDEAQLREIRRRARRSRRSMAAVVREAIGQYLAAPTPARLEGFVGSGEGEPGGDTSARADEILRDLMG